MRISDWSSDVCSSDLEPGVGDGLAAGVGGEGEGGQAEAAPDLGDADAGDDRPGLGGDHRAPASGPASTKTGTKTSPCCSKRTCTGAPMWTSAGSQSPMLARQSVGMGKSVSVRVDLGGRRFIKKKSDATIELTEGE